MPSSQENSSTYYNPEQLSEKRLVRIERSIYTLFMRNERLKDVLDGCIRSFVARLNGLENAAANDALATQQCMDEFQRLRLGVEELKREMRKNDEGCEYSRLDWSPRDGYRE
jgi:hypothetical protein